MLVGRESLRGDEFMEKGCPAASQPERLRRGDRLVQDRRMMGMVVVLRRRALGSRCRRAAAGMPPLVSRARTELLNLCHLKRQPGK